MLKNKDATKITQRLDVIMRKLAHVEETLEEQGKRLVASGRTARGTRDLPPTGEYWVGDNTDTMMLVGAVVRAIKADKRTLQELVVLTGARRNRISGVLYRLQFDGNVTVKNVGTSSRALWWSPPAKR